jgi:hypothetical protein
MWSKWTVLVAFVILMVVGAHASASPLSSQPSFRWMGMIKKYLANQTAPDMVFPGTHDSGPSQIPH